MLKENMFVSEVHQNMPRPPPLLFIFCVFETEVFFFSLVILSFLCVCAFLASLINRVSLLHPHTHPSINTHTHIHTQIPAHRNIHSVIDTHIIFVLGVRFQKYRCPPPPRRFFSAGYLYWTNELTGVLV